MMWREAAVSLRPLTVFTYFVAPLFYVIFFAVALTQNVRTIPYGDTAVRYDRFFLPGLMAMQTFALFALTFSLVRLDRATKVMLQIIISRVKLTTYYYAKLIVSVGMTILKAALITIVAIIMTGQGPVPSLGGLAWMLAGIFLGSAIWLSAGFVAAAVVTREDLRDLLFSILTLPITFASSAYYSLSSAPAWLRAIGVVNPLTYTADVIRAAYFPGLAPEPWPALAGLLVWALVMGAIALSTLNRLAAPSSSA
jgi:ABC-2 type transport system permease protein